MPFASEAQRKFLWLKHPRIAARWAREYPNQKNLPEHVKKDKSEKSADVHADVLGWAQKIRKNPKFAQNYTGTIKHSDLPSHSQMKGLSCKQAFQAGFLLRCLEDGLTADQIAARAEAALEKSANLLSLLGGMVAKPVSALGAGAGKGWLDLVGAGLIGAPLAIGGGAGYLAGKLHNAADTNDAEGLKLDNRISQYHQLADEAERQTKLRKLQDKHPGELIQIA